MKKKRNNPILLLAITIIGSLLSGFVFLFVQGLSLPPTDLAHGQSLFQTLSDPFVQTVLFPVILISTVVALPIVYFFLREKDLRVAVPIVFGSVLFEIVVVTPFSNAAGWLGSYVALVVALFFCKFSRVRSLELSSTSDRGI